MSIVWSLFPILKSTISTLVCWKYNFQVFYQSFYFSLYTHDTHNSRYDLLNLVFLLDTFRTRDINISADHPKENGDCNVEFTCIFAPCVDIPGKCFIEVVDYGMNLTIEAENPADTNTTHCIVVPDALEYRVNVHDVFSNGTVQKEAVFHTTFSVPSPSSASRSTGMLYTCICYILAWYASIVICKSFPAFPNVIMCLGKLLFWDACNVCILLLVMYVCNWWLYRFQWFLEFICDHHFLDNIFSLFSTKLYEWM